jgi:hypothetical protein
MIEFTEIRDALLSSKPAIELDALIRRELKGGIRTSQIYQNIIDLFPQIEEIPDISDDADEGLNGALDALKGWCAPSCRYSNETDADRIEPITQTFATYLSKFPIQDQYHSLSKLFDEMKKNQAKAAMTS